MAKTTVTRVRRPLAEWQHLIAEYDAQPRNRRVAWLKKAGLSPGALYSKKVALKAKSGTIVPGIYLPGRPAAKPTPAKPSAGTTSMTTAEEIEFLRYLLRAARRQGFLSAIIDVE